MLTHIVVATKQSIVYQMQYSLLKETRDDQLLHVGTIVPKAIRRHH